jgi:hypothetical protein
LSGDPKIILCKLNAVRFRRGAVYKITDYERKEDIREELAITDATALISNNFHAELIKQGFLNFKT